MDGIDTGRTGSSSSPLKTRTANVPATATTSTAPTTSSHTSVLPPPRRGGGYGGGNPGPPGIGGGPRRGGRRESRPTGLLAGPRWGVHGRSGRFTCGVPTEVGPDYGW
ncbi:hypothetical protein ACFQY7_46020 [Actinomadura luteofluorescens]|uniref:hypothetical protein n=1 Tax=Actinomadura luteofluorescens TaxID=46163 RepID=UPI003633662C